jgi:hypothetical protein
MDGLALLSSDFPKRLPYDALQADAGSGASTPGHDISADQRVLWLV